jgi:hypothetical protein
MSPSTYKRRTAPQKVASSKEKAEPPKKAAMPPARREEPQQATCEYSESCFTCPLKDCIQSDKKGTAQNGAVLSFLLSHHF